MAAAVANGDAAVVLDEFKPPAGIVLPPREIRNVLEKTAGYVARNGPVFEDRIREKKSRTPRRANEAATAEQKPKGPPKPPDFEFSARMPRLNQKDLEVIRVTAMFVARNGRQWMTTLAQREAGNAQFQFLIPSHTFHSFFQHLVDQYATLIRGHGLTGEGGKLKEERVAELKRNVDEKYHVLARARQRAEYAKYEQMEKAKKEEEEEEKQREFERIDWNDFVVVETITFTQSDATANLPPPTTLSDLQYASLEEKNKLSINPSMRIEEAMPTDEDTPIHAPAAHQPFPPPAEEEEEEKRIRERAEARDRAHQAQASAAGGAPMRIRENYVPKAAQRPAKPGGSLTLCAYCKQMIPVDELEEHIRIELLDPRWKEQKAKADARHLITDLSQVDVAHNLKRLASQRTDVFDGVTGEPVSEEEQARRKKAATTHSFDGNPDGKSQAHINHLQRMTMEEQIKAIHDRFGGTAGQQ
ncbi:unnamed protein product [Parascedosporium putredinis]|uniref:SURP motif domain-containing protein n=1 Tax=Parascedosporium putredinis TaxID=1442378 RepID=A0A9P1MCV5_9PEZI|nr:unnamed protein product [Parascedosporium putredinis]CAI8001369.1 unnamed protein product [Parascedosporium putredinis]